MERFNVNLREHDLKHFSHCHTCRFHLLSILFVIVALWKLNNSLIKTVSLFKKLAQNFSLNKIQNNEIKDEALILFSNLFY